MLEHSTNFLKNVIPFKYFTGMHTITFRCRFSRINRGGTARRRGLMRGAVVLHGTAVGGVVHWNATLYGQ